MAKIAEHGSSPVEELVELLRGFVEKCVFAQEMAFAIILAA